MTVYSSVAAGSSPAATRPGPAFPVRRPRAYVDQLTQPLAPPVPHRTTVPAIPGLDALVAIAWTGVDHLLIPVALLLAAYEPTQGRHRQGVARTIRTHRRGGTR